MSRYKLNFSELNSSSSDVELEFTSANKRASFIAERVIGSNPKRVFTLIISYDDNDDNACDVYVFDQWSCIQDVVQQRWKSFWLLEWSSYEDAYRNALDLKDPNTLCYS